MQNVVRNVLQAVVNREKMSSRSECGAMDVIKNRDVGFDILDNMHPRLARRVVTCVLNVLFGKLKNESDLQIHNLIKIKVFHTQTLGIKEVPTIDVASILHRQKHFCYLLTLIPRRRHRNSNTDKRNGIWLLLRNRFVEGL